MHIIWLTNQSLQEVNKTHMYPDIVFKVLMIYFSKILLSFFLLYLILLILIIKKCNKILLSTVCIFEKQKQIY